MGKKYIKFKNNSQPQEICDMFWETINEYIEYDDDESNDNNSNEPEIDTTEAKEENNSDGISENLQTSGLDFLLKIILMIHNKKKNITGFTKPFDISPYVEKLRYTEIENGTQILSSKKLKAFIDQYRNEVDRYDTNSFYEFIDSLEPV